MKFYERVISDFGGYEAAKKVAESETGAMLHNIKALRMHLLNYRRANSILEVGDSIFLDETGDEIVRVCERHKEMYYNLGFSHATDAEIAAGHRLPRLEVLNDIDIPPNTIILGDK